MTKPSSSAELSRHESLMVLAVFVPTRFDGAANAVGVIPLPTTKSVMLCAGKLTLTAAVENNQKTEKKDNTKLKIKRFFEKFLSIFFSSGGVFSAALLVRFQSVTIIWFSTARLFIFGKFARALQPEHALGHLLKYQKRFSRFHQRKI